MADEYGELGLPPPAPTQTGDAACDPALTALGSFLKAVIVAKCATAWDAVAAGEPVIREVFYFDPNEAEFTERQLPSLFIFSQQGENERIADDWVSDRRQVTVLWIPPPATYEKLSRRGTFDNAIAKVIHGALSRGRDPAWIEPSDTVSVQRDTFGSSLAALGGFLKTITGFRRERVQIVIEFTSGTPRRYPVTRFVIETQELLERDPAAYPGVDESAMHTDVTNTDYGDTPYTVQVEG